MNKEEIITVLSELHKISGFRVSLHGADFTEIAAYPEHRMPFCECVNRNRDEHIQCLECDRLACLAAREKRGTHIYRCRYGLTEAVSPLYNFGTLTGFLMMGQISAGDEPPSANPKLKRFLQEAGEDTVMADRIPCVDADMVSSYIRIMTICAEYLTLSNSMYMPEASREETARRYINDNLTKRLTVEDICRHVGCSRSTLLTTFKRGYGITVNDYITERRLALARDMLLEGKKTVNEIALESGFSDQSYFSKVFSAGYGITPSEYRRGLHRDGEAGKEANENNTHG